MIRVRRSGDRYSAEVTPPESKRGPWSTGSPLGLGALLDALRGLGVHQTDIGDALTEADPGWLDRPDGR